MEKLKSSEENFRTFFETIDDMIFIANRDGKIFYTNAAVSRKLGYSETEVNKMQILDVHPAELREDAMQIFGDMFAGKRSSCPLPLARKDGTFLPVETRIWFGKWDGLDCIFGISKDISAQQEALQKFNKIFNNNPALMAISRLPERVISDVNQAFLAKTEFSKDEIIGKTSKELGLFYQPEKQKKVADELEKNGFIHDLELNLKTKSGKILNGLFSGEIIESQGKKYFLTVMTDITAQKQSELLATKANRTKSEFLANMSHEIRTPLNGIIGFTDLLQNTPLDETQQKYLDNANKSARLLLEIINDILDFSKIEAGKLDLEIVKTDILELIEHSVDIIKHSTSKKGLELSLNIGSNIPRFAFVDPLRLKPILINLLSNAIKFTEKGEVELKVRFIKPEDSENIGQFTFSVRDTGTGIKKENLEKLFKAFSQGDASTTRKFGGTGLGLVISNMLAEKMGSRIEVVSEFGKGSKFSFSIKATFENDNICLEGKKEKETKTYNFSGFSPTILIAEDSEINMMLAKILVSQLMPQAKIIEATNGFEAIEKFIEFLPNYILMDIQMPEIDGYEAAKQIRKYELKNGGHIPIIALTAGAMKGEKEKCFEAGMDDFITKPIEKNSLYAGFEKFLMKNQGVEPKKSIETQRLHFNAESLKKRLSGNMAAFNELKNIVLPQMDEKLNKLESAIKNSSVDDIKSKAHSIKGTALNMSFEILADLSSEIEKNSDQNQNIITSIFDKIKNEWEIIQLELEL